jgi:hypothetical protein
MFWIAQIAGWLVIVLEIVFRVNDSLGLGVIPIFLTCVPFLVIDIIKEHKTKHKD